jgi:hypothetical protein
MPGLNDVLPDEQPDTRGQGAAQQRRRGDPLGDVKPRADRTVTSCSEIGAIFRVGANAASAVWRLNARVLVARVIDLKHGALPDRPAVGCRVSRSQSRREESRTDGSPGSRKALTHGREPCRRAYRLLAEHPVVTRRSYIAGDGVVAGLASCLRWDLGLSTVWGVW